MAARDAKGRFAGQKKVNKAIKKPLSVTLDHVYCGQKPTVTQERHRSDKHLNLPENASRDGWRDRRIIVELGVLLDNLEYCEKCKLGPVSMNKYSVVGELKKGLSGFLYVRCSNLDCEHVNRVPYGKTHRVKEKGMPCFAANTKLGVAMIDSIGGSGKVNNMLSTLNIAPINKRNLQDMERRAGRFVESVAQQSIDTAAQETFQKEMSEISQEESKVAAASMECLIEDLGIAALPDTSPATKSILQSSLVTASMPSNVTDSADTPSPSPRRHRRKCRPFGHGRSTTIRKNLLSMYKAKSRYGMSCSADTAWQKRGFDSLTSHTFFMSSSKMGKKIVKSVISHRQCSTCNWWRRH